MGVKGFARGVKEGSSFVWGAIGGEGGFYIVCAGLFGGNAGDNS